MEPFFRPYEPDRQYLLPPSLRDWLPEDHLAYFISDTVDELDLGAFLARYRQTGSGNVAYHPALLCKLLLYGYATGLEERKKQEDAEKLEAEEPHLVAEYPSAHWARAERTRAPSERPAPLSPRSSEHHLEAFAPSDGR